MTWAIVSIIWCVLALVFGVLSARNPDSVLLEACTFGAVVGAVVSLIGIVGTVLVPGGVS